MTTPHDNVDNQTIIKIFRQLFLSALEMEMTENCGSCWIKTLVIVDICYQLTLLVPDFGVFSYLKLTENFEQSAGSKEQSSKFVFKHGPSRRVW